ncbi:Glycerophosphodiester phosphodiesterase GDPD5 [Zancudomyces culisetae]|uniref:glycerophosphodiester phosphodiesterase n=1 Tax=Zancudomyces culisetae TaxID=1213189 RepID=A0A1R1PQ05_ZANCU|nr:Glycerophosphodiester phosphodiesterase GDPD5 [Zancudomyces culisetae]|eukprot:OMH82962.1 Glycerophosphodiester phosphodiesterase GDPD5 [Zancudomyces culisetae]
MYLNLGVLAALYSLQAVSGKSHSGCQWNTLDGKPSIILGHRGEKAYMPEHTLGSYELAAFEGAEYIEPDLVMTRDGVVVIVHDLGLGRNTNIQDLPQFADRKRHFVYDGKYTSFNETDWYVFDFDYAELKQLYNVREKTCKQCTDYLNNVFHIPTFEEYLVDIERLKMIHNNKSFGVVPELKSPEIFNEIIANKTGKVDRHFEKIVLGLFEKHGYNVTKQPEGFKAPNVFDNFDGKNLLDYAVNIEPKFRNENKVAGIQSFDLDTITYLKGVTSIPLLYLDQDTPHLYTPKGIQQLAGVVDVFGFNKNFLVSGPEKYFKSKGNKYNEDEIKAMGGFLTPKGIVSACHANGIAVSTYTHYDSKQANGLICQQDKGKSSSVAVQKRSTMFENIKRGINFARDTDRDSFCPSNKREELYHFFELGVDYMFCENIFEAQMLRLGYHYERN